MNSRRRKGAILKFGKNILTGIIFSLSIALTAVLTAKLTRHKDNGDKDDNGNNGNNTKADDITFDDIDKIYAAIDEKRADSEIKGISETSDIFSGGSDEAAVPRRGRGVLKFIGFILVLVLALLCAAQPILHTDGLNESPFSNTYVWNSPSYTVARGSEIYVVDSNKRTVSLVNENGEIYTIIRGEGGESSFSNTNYIASDGNYIYIADLEYASSGTRISNESIKKFDMSGNYVETIFYREYPEGKDTMPAQNGFIRWMGFYEDSICFIYYDNATLSLNRITLHSYTILRRLSGEDIPDVWNISYSKYDDTIWLASKTGRIYRQTGSNEEFSLYDTSFAGDPVFIDIAAYGENVYASDLVSHQVFNIITQEAVIACEDPLEGAFINRISAYEGGIATTDNESIILAADGEDIVYSEAQAQFRKDIFINILLSWAALCALALIVLVFLIMVLVYTLKNSHSRYTGMTFVAVFAVVVSTALIANMVLNEMFTRLSDSTSDTLIRTASIITDSAPTNGLGDAVASIKSPDDYGSPEYKFIQSYLDTFCDASYDNNSNMYFAVQKYNDSFIYGICDYERTIGAYFPVDYYEDSGYGEVIETGEMIVVVNDADEFGVWSFVIAPIMDSSGNITGTLELGVNMITEQQQNSEMIFSIIIRIAVIILLIVLLLIEGANLVNGISGFRLEKDPNIPYFLRPMIFLTFFASNLSAAFIPQLSQEIYDNSGINFAGSLASALPMSLQLFAIAIAAAPAGKLMEKISLKPLMTAACVIQIAGYAVISFGAYTQQYIPFSVGHIVSGLGIGAVIVALNTMPDRVKDEELRNNYYSNLNAGIISGVVIGLSIGSYIADAMGHAFTFVVSGIVVVLIGVLVIISVGQKRLSHADRAEEISFSIDERPFRLGNFLGSPSVLSFVLCVMMPLLVLMYFKDYLFPLYGSENGMSDVSIGNIMLFAGAISIVFGTVLADWLFKKVGSFGVITLSSLSTSACLVVFGLLPSVETAVAVVFVLSLTAGFGLAGQEVYYSSLYEFRKYGAKRAMSLYSIFDNISQTAAPLLMGALLVLGYSKECLLLGGCGAGLYLIFMFIKLISNKITAKRIERIERKDDRVLAGNGK